MAEAPLGIVVRVAILVFGRRFGLEMEDAGGPVRLGAFAFLAAIALQGAASFSQAADMQDWIGFSTLAGGVGWLALVIAAFHLATVPDEAPDRN